MNDRKTKKFFAFSLAITLSFVAIYFAAFRLQVGSPVNAEWWAKSVLDYKQYYAEQVKGPKLIISSGSNALFGIDSQKLEGIVNYPVVNLSLHAGLNLKFLYFQLEKYVQEGDVIVMPLEYFYYFDTLDTANLSNWFVSNMIAWGKEDYLDKLPLSSYLSFIVNTPKERILRGLYNIDKPSKVPSLNEIVERLEEIHKSQQSRFKGYSYLSLTKNGDMLPFMRPEKLIFSIYLDGNDYLTTVKTLSTTFLASYERIKFLASSRGAKLLLTWPVTIRNHAFDLTNHSHQERILRFSKSLEFHDIKIYCEPSLFNIHYKFFYNTIYHMNAMGAEMRTQILGDCINDVLNDRVKPYTFESSLERLRNLEAKYDYGLSGYERYEKKHLKQ